MQLPTLNAQLSRGERIRRRSASYGATAPLYAARRRKGIGGTLRREDAVEGRLPVQLEVGKRGRDARATIVEARSNERRGALPKRQASERTKLRRVAALQRGTRIGKEGHSVMRRGLRTRRLQNMRFCETNPIYGEAMFDVTSYTEGCYD